MEKIDMNKRYRIIVDCDAYHGQLYCGKHDQVLKRSGCTPICWVEDDNFGRGYSLQDSHIVLDKYAKMHLSNYKEFDDGIYNDFQERIYAFGTDDSFEYDVRTFSIEEFNPKANNE